MTPFLVNRHSSTVLKVVTPFLSGILGAVEVPNYLVHIDETVGEVQELWYFKFLRYLRWFHTDISFYGLLVLMIIQNQWIACASC